MADNETPMSPLDPLGPSFGKINAPSLDAQGLSSFEGDHLSMKPINFPAPNKFMVPGSDGMVQRKADVRANLAGSPPNPTSANNPNAFRGKSVDEVADIFTAKARAISQANQDTNDYARIYAYDAGPDGGAFYKRYHAYGQEKFDEVGFHPFRDNESLFNARTNGWNDFSRMMTHAAVPLFSRGFVSGPKSLWKMLHGDFSGDPDDARIYAEAAAIGQSSKGGALAFMNNAAMNFSYSAGIITEALAEELVGLLLAAPTGGTSAVATTANVGRNLYRLGKGIDTAMDLSRATTSTLRSLENVNNARKFWSAAKAEKALKSPLGRFLNPLENLTEAGFNIAKNEKNLTGLAKLSQTAGGFYKDVRGFNMALSEARLEAGMNQNDIYKDLYNDHYLQNGEPPSDEMQQMLLQTAKEGSATTLGWNTGLIYLSNKLVIPNIVGPRGGLRRFLNSKTEDILNLEDGFIRKGVKDVTLKSGKKVALPEYSYVQKSVRNTLTSFYKDPLRKSIKGGLAYFKGNISEGLQENAQEVIAEATKSYYIDKFKDPQKVEAIGSFEYARALTNSAIKNQFTAQGLETFASGFVMGMFAGPLNNVPLVVSKGYNKMFKPEEYANYIQQKENYGKSVTDALNSQSVSEFFDSKIMDYGTQVEANNLGDVGTEKESRDAANASLISKMRTLMRHNLTDTFKENLNALKGLTPEEFEEALGLEQGTGEKYLAKIDTVNSKIDRIKQRNDYYVDRFPNPVSRDDLKALEGTADYEKVALLHEAWNVGIDNAVFFNESFEDTTSRMNSIMNDVVSNSPLDKASSTDVKVLFDEDLLDNEIGFLKSDVKSLKDAPTEFKKDLKQKEEKLKALEDLKETIDTFVNFTNNRKQIVDTLLEQGYSEEEVYEELLNVHSEALSNAKEGFDNYFKALAGKSGIVFNDNLEAAFEKFVDFRLLSNEQKALVKSINLLHDPQGFLEHIQRNQEWMKDLYSRRAEYYEDLKNKAFESNENNAFLNELANRGIYVSLDDFKRWQEEGILPEEFYRDTDKSVIREGHPEYDEIANLFQMLEAIQTHKDKVGLNDPIVKAKLEELDAQEAAEIEKLPKTEVREEIGEIKPAGNSKFVKVENINKDLADDEYAGANYDTEKTDDDYDYVFYKEGENLRYNNADGEVVDIKNFAKISDSKNKFTKAVKFKLAMRPDPEAVAKIREEFEKRRQEVLQEFVERGQIDAVPVEKKPITSESSLEEIAAESAELYNALVVSFEQYAEKAGMDDLQGDDYDDALRSYIRSNYNAQEIINEYNKNKELSESTKTSDQVSPVLMLGNKKLNLDEMAEEDIRSYLRTFEAGLKVLQGKAEPTEEELKKINDYKYQIRVIEEYLGKRAKSQFTPEQQATVDKVNKIVQAQDDLLKTPGGYVINGKVLSRVTNVIKQFAKDEYKYVKEDAVIAAFRTTIEETGLNDQSIGEFIDQLKKQSLPGFSGFTYTELERELKTITPEQQLSSEDILQRILGTILEKTYEASRISGNYIDDQVRNVFDNKAAVYDESKISREAYDQLFSKDPENLGYITLVKNFLDKKGYHVISRVVPKNAEERGLVVFDEEAGVAGEVDLLAVDRLGKIHIIDVKTGQAKKWKGFEVQGNVSSKKDNYTLQQTAYANLIYNLTGGLQSEINLLPIEVDYTEETGKITKGGKPSPKGFMADGQFILPLVPSQEIQEMIDSVIPRRGVAEVEVVETPESSEDGETSPYEDFNKQDYEGLPETPAEPIGIDPNVVTAIQNATQEQLDNVKKVLAQKVNDYDVNDVLELQRIIDERQRELDSNVKVKYNTENTASGATFISKNTIFTDKKNKEMFASEGDIVTVIKVDKLASTLIMENTNNNLRKTITFDELNSAFELESRVMDFDAGATEDEAPLTRNEKSFIKESSENVNNLLRDQEKKEALKKEAKKQSLDEVDDELFNDVTSDC